MKLVRALIVAAAGVGLFAFAAPADAQMRGHGGGSVAAFHGHPGGWHGGQPWWGWHGHPGWDGVETSPLDSMAIHIGLGLSAWLPTRLRLLCLPTSARIMAAAASSRL